MLISFGAHAQYQIRLIDANNGRPIANATIASLDTANAFSVAADQHREALIPGEAPLNLLITHLGYATVQHTLQETTAVEVIALAPQEQWLDEVVITGQYTAQSAMQSVYRVRSIDNKRIEAQAANSLQDVLSNELNIRFSRDNATGVAGMSLQGISGQNVKVLIDGVPMVGRSGVANEIDLNQINVNSIEKIEIVEGPMAVNYGADALAGVINIITKKGSGQKITLNASLQEETVGREYSLFDEGIHNASVSLGYQLAPRWYAQAETRINRFGGWTGTGEGRDKSWYPKTQQFNTGLLKYATDEVEIYYRLDHLHEIIENLGPVNSLNPLRDPFALDEEYIAKRWMHQLQADVALDKAQWSTVLSFTDYHRNTYQFVRNMVTQDQITTVAGEQDTITYASLFMRSTLSTSDLLGMSDWQISSQVGVESTKETADGTTLSDGSKDIWNHALFGSVELKKGKLGLRPGVRFSHNSSFTTIPTGSINVKYDLTPKTQFRFGYGRGFRAPSVRELYHEFIDANHNLLGNENLRPEYSHNFNADVAYQWSKIHSTLNLSGFYNHIEDRITFFVPEEANQPTTYTNLLQFQSLGGSTLWKYQHKALTASAGFAYIGRYQQLRAEALGDIPTFVFTPEVNASASYLWALPQITLSAFYKYTGPAKNYQLVSDEEGNSSPQLLGIDPFQFLDVTLSKNWRNGLSLGIGARNLLDVTSVNNNFTGGTAHGGGGGAAPIAYGRSYFARLTYQFTKN